MANKMTSRVCLRLFFAAFVLQCIRQINGHGHSHENTGHGHAHDHHGDAHDHGHAHDHGDAPKEPASFKYSRQANEPRQQPSPEIHGHQHSHGSAGDSHAHSHEHEVHEHHGHSHDDHAHEEDVHVKRSPEIPVKQSPERPKPDTGMWLWIQALGSTALVSAAPVLILIFIPLDNTEEHRPFLKVLLSFASGGLLGDAFLHLIPHAISPHSHGTEDDSHSHSHSESHGHVEHDHSHNMSVGLWVLTGIVAFLAVEKFVRYVKGSHSHSHATVSDVKTSQKTGDTKKENKDDSVRKRKVDGDSKEVSETEKKKSHDHSHATTATTGDIKVSGYLNLAADFTHNFTDGLAIGASYLVGHNIGIVTTITILLHEVPHEVGDFAILIQSGCSKRKAMLLQLTTAAGAMVGTLCSLMAEGAGDLATSWILPFTAGGFIYIATVSVIPELLEDSKIWQSVKEIAALLTGILMMVFIAGLE